MIRTSTAYAAFCVSIAAFIVSQLLIKSRFEHLGIGDALDRGLGAVAGLLLRDSACWFAGTLVVVGGLSWYIAMTRMPLHMMLPLSAIITPATSIGAYLLFGEQLSAQKWAAIGLITAGVAWLGSMRG